eukprot:CAMPEP_0114601360 /NCGR_PEP_ID=MMETSP0125-20121206/23988_1 /TAXON_ID=485358 ORGANISM="Aristerostoma sp., Strain ATCC 50986" /NCGR_SAMPLE_ID=MMETSP0125 /ASSEMBLY_ACC=CAM_ASM_000245 /LENGTH=62 /DNA_ID=CAMNT_0001810529 /DNA_START=64 /DNA_END=252 /DNA_ORIENTATION=+
METLRHPDNYTFFWFNIKGELAGKADAVRRPKENTKDRYSKDEHHQYNSGPKAANQQINHHH